VPISGFFEAPLVRRIDDDRFRDRAPMPPDGRFSSDLAISSDLPVNTPGIWHKPRSAGRNTADTDLPPIVHLR